MCNIKNIVILLSLKGILGYSEEDIVSALTSIGFTDEDIKELNQYSIKQIWIISLQEYGKNYTLPVNIVNILQLSLIDFKDLQMRIEMQDFLNNPSYDKGEKLYNKINNSISKDNIKYSSEILFAIRTKPINRLIKLS